MSNPQEIALIEPNIVSFTGVDELSVFTCEPDHPGQERVTYIRMGNDDAPGDTVGIPQHLIGPLWRTLRRIEEDG